MPDWLLTRGISRSAFFTSSKERAQVLAHGLQQRFPGRIQKEVVAGQQPRGEGPAGLNTPEVAQRGQAHTSRPVCQWLKRSAVTSFRFAASFLRPAVELTLAAR